MTRCSNYFLEQTKTLIIICLILRAVTRRGKARSTIPTGNPLPNRDRAPRRL